MYLIRLELQVNVLDYLFEINVHGSRGYKANSYVLTRKCELGKTGDGRKASCTLIITVFTTAENCLLQHGIVFLQGR